MLCPSRVEAQVRVGLDDPVATGQAYGLAQGLANARGWAIAIEPDFTGPTLGGVARAEWAVRPAAVLWPLVTLAVSWPVWRAIGAAVRA